MRTALLLLAACGVLMALGGSIWAFAYIWSELRTWRERLVFIFVLVCATAYVIVASGLG